MSWGSEKQGLGKHYNSPNVHVHTNLLPRNIISAHSMFHGTEFIKYIFIITFIMHVLLVNHKCKGINQNTM